MSEAVQADLAALKLVAQAGVRPGIPVQASLVGHDLILEVDGRCVLPASFADHLFIATA